MARPAAGSHEHAARQKRHPAAPRGRGLRVRVRADRRQAGLSGAAAGPHRQSPARRFRGGVGRPSRHPGPQRRDPGDRHQADQRIRRAASHHRQGRGRRTADRRAAGRGRQRAARAARRQEGLRVGQARHHGEPAGRSPPPGPARHRLPAREPPRVPQRPDRGPRARLHQPGQPGHRRHREVDRRTGARRPARRRLPAHARRPETHHPVDQPESDPRGPGRARQGHRALQGEIGRRRHHGRQHRRGGGLRVAARLRPQQSGRRAGARPHQPPDGGGLRDGLHLQGHHHGHGAGGPEGHAEQPRRCAREPALRPLHHPRLPPRAPGADRAGGVQVFLQHRHRAHRHDGGRGGPQGLPAQDGPARPAAHRAARERRPAGAAQLERAQHHHDRVRPGAQCRPVAGHDGGGRAQQRRQPDPADLPEAGGERRARQIPAGDPARSVGGAALHHAAERRGGLGQEDQHPGLLRGRQDRHGRQDHPRPLRQGQGVHDLHVDRAGRQAQIPVPDPTRRPAGGAGHLRVPHRGLELGRGVRPDHAAHLALLDLPPNPIVPQTPFPLVARLGIGMDNILR